MSKEILERIPNPRGHGLLMLRQRVLPAAVFALALLMVGHLWHRRLGVPVDGSANESVRHGTAGSTGGVAACRESRGGEAAPRMVSDAR
ncbi:MAG: hypothetical protein JNK85_05820 [Verrucomicrobiales bacterium]|nr:hypothetical protein [Verrucomicrobiales bacterium]